MQFFEGPRTFFVSDVAKAADNDAVKLEWLNMELGPGHDLVAFAEKFVSLLKRDHEHSQTKVHVPQAVQEMQWR